MMHAKSDKMDERFAKFNDHKKGMKVFIQYFFAKFQGEFFSARRKDKYTLTLFRIGVVGREWGKKDPSTSSSPVTSTNVRISH